MLRAPTSTAPAASRRAITVASRAAGARSRLIFEPASVGNPSMSNRFLTANGTPASGPSGRPAARAASTALACARARAVTTAVNALSTRSSFAIRASAASVTALALIVPSATAAAISLACDQAVIITCTSVGWGKARGAPPDRTQDCSSRRAHVSTYIASRSANAWARRAYVAPRLPHGYGIARLCPPYTSQKRGLRREDRRRLGVVRQREIRERRSQT